MRSLDKNAIGLERVETYKSSDLSVSAGCQDKRRGRIEARRPQGGQETHRGNRRKSVKKAEPPLIRIIIWGKVLTELFSLLPLA
jgi:hypothetical protein